VDNVKIEYSVDNGDTWTEIATVSAAGQSYAWSVPYEPSPEALVKITDTSNPGNTAESDIFTITIGGLWGDADDDDTVNVVDALKIATYDVDPEYPSLQSIMVFITHRGDVNASDVVDITDALICASYELDPDNPNLPPRVGNSVDTVEKIASYPLSSPGKYAIPEMQVYNNKHNEYIVTPIIKTNNPDILIGAASVSITWNPDNFRYVGTESKNDKLIINDKNAESGEIRMGRIEVIGENPFVFPAIHFTPTDENVTDFFSLEIKNTTMAGTFEQLTFENGSNTRIKTINRVPAGFTLNQNIPNPFNPSTTIQYSVSRPTHIKLVLYSIHGQKIKTLVDRFDEPGVYNVIWDATNDSGITVATGVYIYQLLTGDTQIQKQMLLLR